MEAKNTKKKCFHGILSVSVSVVSFVVFLVQKFRYTLRLDSGSVLEKSPYCWEARDKVKDFLCKTKEKEEKVKAFYHTAHTAFDHQLT